MNPSKQKIYYQQEGMDNPANVLSNCQDNENQVANKFMSISKRKIRNPKENKKCQEKEEGEVIQNSQKLKRQQITKQYVDIQNSDMEILKFDGGIKTGNNQDSKEQSNQQDNSEVIINMFCEDIRKKKSRRYATDNKIIPSISSKKSRPIYIDSGYNIFAHDEEKETSRLNREAQQQQAQVLLIRRLRNQGLNDIQVQIQLPVPVRQHQNIFQRFAQQYQLKKKEEIEDQQKKEEIEDQLKKGEIEDQLKKGEIEDQLKKGEIEDQLKKGEIEDQLKKGEIEDQLKKGEIEDQLKKGEIEDQLKKGEIEDQLKKGEIEDQLKKGEIEDQLKKGEIEDQLKKGEIEDEETKNSLGINQTDN